MGGVGRDRTGCLLNANQTLSRVSYDPRFGAGPRPPPRGRGEAAAGADPLQQHMIERASGDVESGQINSLLITHDLRLVRRPRGELNPHHLIDNQAAWPLAYESLSA